MLHVPRPTFQDLLTDKLDHLLLWFGCKGGLNKRYVYVTNTAVHLYIVTSKTICFVTTSHQLIDSIGCILAFYSTDFWLSLYSHGQP